MLSKCLRNAVNATIRYNSFVYTLKPLKLSECTELKNVYQFSRQFSSNVSKNTRPNPKTTENISAQSIAYYSMAVVVMCVGLSYAAVPLYRLFCQVNLLCEHLI